MTFDEAEYARWLRAATEHLAAARHAQQGAFHAQAVLSSEQAAQCALKAVLHGVGVPETAGVTICWPLSRPRRSARGCGCRRRNGRRSPAWGCSTSRAVTRTCCPVALPRTGSGWRSRTGPWPVVWTVPEWARARARRNPIAVEAAERGVWLRGTPTGLAASSGGE